MHHSQTVQHFVVLLSKKLPTRSSTHNIYFLSIAHTLSNTHYMCCLTLADTLAHYMCCCPPPMAHRVQTGGKLFWMRLGFGKLIWIRETSLPSGGSPGRLLGGSTKPAFRMNEGQPGRLFLIFFCLKFKTNVSRKGDIFYFRSELKEKIRLELFHSPHGPKYK